MNKQNFLLAIAILGVLFSYDAINVINAKSVLPLTKITYHELFQLNYVGKHATLKSTTVVSWNANFIVATYADDPNVYVFDTSKKELTFTLNASHAEDNPVAISWSPDGKFIAAAFSVFDEINIWNISEKEHDPLIIQSHDPQSIAWDSKGDKIAVLSVEPLPSFLVEATVYDAQTGKILATLKTNTESFGQVAWSMDGKLIAAAYSGASGLQLWDASTYENLHSIQDIGSPISWNKDNNRLAGTVCRFKGNCTINIWNVGENKLNNAFEVDMGGLNSLEWNPTEDLLAGSGHEKVQVWNPESGELLADLGTYIGEISALSWNLSGNMIAIGDGDGVIHVGELTF